MAIKLLVNAEAGVGKTTSISSFGNETFVVSRDAKDFTLPIPHMVVDSWYDMKTFLYGGKVIDGADTIQVDGVTDKIAAYTEKMGQPPKNVVIDSVSQIWLDVIEKASLKPNVYGSQGSEATKELGLLTKFIHEYLELNGVNIILLNHIIKEKLDGKPTGTFIPFGTGKFKDKGAFYSIVNESITIEAVGSNRCVYTKDIDKLARTTLKDIPEKMWMENIINPDKTRKLKDDEEYFTLKGHLDKLEAAQANISDFRL